MSARSFRRALALAAVALAVRATTRAARADRLAWTGSAACGTCHPAQYAAWQRTPHATTARHLPPGAPPARCLPCHGTGEAPAGPTIATEVGCEACHGAGAAYGPDDVMRDPALARALGLADLSTPARRAAACAGCHASRAIATRDRSFDPTAPVHPSAPVTPP